ncbi:MAG TPA: hypothetical protein DD381_07000 [Lentisphaeria bacterium]|nr:MAG: hypothetical protein A2X47_10905 [Lentisphaerae bacterium GWF2_38_69]HBM16071.1 hypothetical protein [Lentisphaeria bacterium]
MTENIRTIHNKIHANLFIENLKSEKGMSLKDYNKGCKLLKTLGIPRSTRADHEEFVQLLNAAYEAVENLIRKSRRCRLESKELHPFYRMGEELNKIQWAIYRLYAELEHKEKCSDKEHLLTYEDAYDFYARRVKDVTYSSK